MVCGGSRVSCWCGMTGNTPNTVSQLATYTGATTAAVSGGLGFNEWLGIGGLTVAVIGLIFNIWFSFKYRKVKK